MDIAHQETDKILAEMEKRIKKEYKQAEREVRQKLDDYMERFKKKDEKKRLELMDLKKDVQNHKISWNEYRLKQSEYWEWRKGQIIMSSRWEQMRDTLAKDYHNANKIAKSIVNGYMPEVYALNYNYGSYEVEHGLGIDTSFTLYSKETVEHLLRENPDLLPKPGKYTSELIRNNIDLQWNKQQIQSVMLQGILQGESIPKLAKRLAETVGDKNMHSAIRNARTMTTRAENYGRMDAFRRAQGQGINLKKQWVATLDHRTRDSHVDVDGEIRGLNETFSNGLDCPGGMGPPEEVYNCFVGDVYATSDSEIIRSYKHRYEGEIISIKTAGGVEFTCTPNHPILTPRGWIVANLLDKGNHILVTFVGNEHSFGVNPNVDHVLTRFDAIHEFIEKFGSKRTCALGVNFHGDIPTSEVEIVTQKRFLRNYGNAGKFGKQDKLRFKDANPSLMSKGTFMEHLRSVWLATLGFISGMGKTLSLFVRSMGHSGEHSLGSVPNRDAVFTQYSINDTPADTEIRSELLVGLTGKVFLDKIVSVNRYSTSCHVYNLQTGNGYYFVNSNITQNNELSNGIVAIAKNCRCTMITVFDEKQDDIRKNGLRDESGLGSMSYKEWREYHREKLRVKKERQWLKSNYRSVERG